MKISLHIPDKYQTELDIPEGAVIEDLYREYRDVSPYTCVAAKVDNEYRSLTDRLDRSCRVELLDVRDPGACRVYQAGISSRRSSLSILLMFINDPSFGICRHR